MFLNYCYFCTGIIPGQYHSYTLTRVCVSVCFYLQFGLEIVRNASKNQDNPEAAQNAYRVANRLIEFAEEFEENHASSLSDLEYCFRQADKSVQQMFLKAIYGIRRSLSWEMVARLFHLGVRLLKNLTPHDSRVHEQQWELLIVFITFLRDELSSWIRDQGGWVSSFLCLFNTTLITVQLTQCHASTCTSSPACLPCKKGL